MTTHTDAHGTSYVVMNENTLGYINPVEMPGQMGVLARTIDGHCWQNGPVWILISDVLRSVTAADFKTFRCVPPPWFKG